jgi:hydrogenase maturation protease
LEDVKENEILILGIGNPLCGDDGAGIRLAEIIAEGELPQGVQIEQAGLPGLGLPTWLEGRATVILLDAVEMGLAPGDWRRLEWGQVDFAMQEGALSLHQPDLSSGLALAQALSLIPERLEIYAIQPGTTEPGAAMSAEVSAILPGLADIILDELSELGS